MIRLRQNWCRHWEAEARITQFHELKKSKTLWLEETAPGITLGVKTTPLDRVGAYIHGGRAAYPSTVLMTTIAARVAGVPEIVVCMPPPVGKPADAGGPRFGTEPSLHESAQPPPVLPRTAPQLPHTPFRPSCPRLRSVSGRGFQEIRWQARCVYTGEAPDAESTKIRYWRLPDQLPAVCRRSHR
ncbi:MAG: histidinol dehydrogenase [Methanocorpusculum sp.]|nr:histidinol dehydrogenase [Methanocorpusculum sp.]